MTETQATSGAAGASTNPVDAEAEGATPSGRAAVGRAAVPATDAQSAGPAPGGPQGPGSGAQPPEGAAPGAEAGQPGAGSPGGSDATGTVRYTRAPGMPAPPDTPTSGAGGLPGGAPPGMAHHGPPGAGPYGGLTPGSLTPGGGLGVAADHTAPIGVGASVGRTAPHSGLAAAVVSASAAVPIVAAPSGAPGAPVSAPPGAGGAARPVTGRVAVGAVAGRGVAVTAPGVGAARVTETTRTSRGSASAAATRGARRARLTVKRIDPWSVMKFSFAVSLVLFIVVIVATAVLYLALDTMGVFDSVNNNLADLLSSAGGADGGPGFKITAKGVIGTAALLGLVNVVLITALATLGAFIYNVCADLVGGVELTLSERD